MEPEVGHEVAPPPLEPSDATGESPVAAPAESQSDSQPAPQPDAQPAPQPAPQPALTIPKSRAGGAWKGLVPALVASALILVFVFQNLRETKVTFLTFSGRFPLALAVLASAALGALVVFLLGSVRIVQLRKAFRRHQSGHETMRGES